MARHDGRPRGRSRLPLLHFICGLAIAATGGCVGELTPADVAFLDTDGDGLRDAVDADRDQVVDYRFAESEDVDRMILASGWCPDLADVLVDVDGDGIADALDLDCDGEADVIIFPDGSADGGGDGGQGGGAATSCDVSVAVDGDTRRVTCEGDGTASDCQCYENDVLVGTCTTTAEDACVVPGSCCAFDTGDPADPSDPGDPGDPADPGDPDDPADPGDPDDPADPDDGGSATCQSSISVNGQTRTVTCEGGATRSCECTQDGVLVDTCTTSSAAACSLPDGSCCDFP